VAKGSMGPTGGGEEEVRSGLQLKGQIEVD